MSSYFSYFRSVCYSSLHQLTLAHRKSKKMRADRSRLLLHSSLALSLFRQAPSLLLSFQGRRLKINPPNQPLDETCLRATLKNIHPAEFIFILCCWNCFEHRFNYKSFQKILKRIQYSQKDLFGFYKSY